MKNPFACKGKYVLKLEELVSELTDKVCKFEIEQKRLENELKSHKTEARAHSIKQQEKIYEQIGVINQKNIEIFNLKTKIEQLQEQLCR